MEEKKKVLFVVYRTEWWGCLDSYCRQECEAEDTVCYVMPVPRYERDDIAFQVDYSKVHFHPEELELELPEGACLVDWQTFPLEQGFERIYVHNPYDNNNLTDSTEPKFYSSNLKPYTRKLIYVPHFMDLIPAEYMNGHVYDYVDAIYVPRESSRFLLDVKYEAKVEVVPSGIPAYLDRLAKRREDERQQKCPSERRERISGGRMRLLYCVSFSDLYHGTEKQLAKMREIFDYAAKSQDIQLIFRPDEEIRAKRRMLDEKIWREYERLVARFKSSRTGIYDESLNLYKAAVDADGILSNNHPLNALFSVQGKYVLRVDLNQRRTPSKEERCTPTIWSAVVTEKDGEIELMFVPLGTKLICQTVIPAEVGLPATGGRASNIKAAKSGTAGSKAAKAKAKKHLSGPKVEVLAEVPDEITGGLNYMTIHRCGNCLYLSPCNSDGIWKYDMDRRYFGKAYLPDVVVSPVSAVFSYGGYLYMAPANYPGIIKYDTETEEISVIDGWIEEMEPFVPAEWEKEPYFSWAVLQEGHMLYMASSKCDVWMEFDMERDSWQLKPMNLPGKRFVHMAKDGDWVWLLPYEGDEIVLWNRASGEGQVIYASENKNRERGIAPYLFALDLGEAVAAFPQWETDHVLVISKAAAMEALQGKAAAGDMPTLGGATAGSPSSEQKDAVASAPMDRKEARLLEEKDVRMIKHGIPCSPRDSQFDWSQTGCGYQFIKRLESGLILAYEYYDGSFLLMDGELNLVRRIPCRLPIELVRQQKDVQWRNARYRYGYSGVISEGGSIPLLMESFMRHGREDRERVREYYRQFYNIP